MTSDHEAVCTRCGECCRVKVVRGRSLFVLPFYCPAMDVKTKTCRIYSDRHRILLKALGEVCQTHERAMIYGDYPSHCTYAPKRSFTGVARHHSEMPRWVLRRMKLANMAKRAWLSIWLAFHPKIRKALNK